MKIKKIIFLLILIICLTGCEATYNLKITDTTMSETVDFWVLDNENNKNILSQYLSTNYMSYYDMDNRQSNNYEKKELNKNNKIGMRLTYSYDDENLQHSSLLNRCYYKKSITKTKNEIVITTDGNNRCFYKDGQKQLDKLTVKIITDLKVTENNADKINGDTYIWKINQSNYQNHPITMKIKIPDEQTKHSFNFIILIIVLLSILIVSLIAYLYLKKMNKKNNEL